MPSCPSNPQWCGPLGALGGRLEYLGDVMVGSQCVGAMSSRRPDSSRFRDGWACCRWGPLAGPRLGLFAAFFPFDLIFVQALNTRFGYGF